MQSVASHIGAKALPVFNRLLKIFPKQYDLAFAYGSGVFQQTGHANIKNNMLDVIFIVKSPEQWHRKNLEENRRHYSFLKVFGPRSISRIQDGTGAVFISNTLVPWENRLIKYGVISRHRFVQDMLDWDTLYISGRLHKPVLWLKDTRLNKVNTAVHVNLQSAVHTALLMLPECFNEQDLFLSIAGISYSGDFRMTVGEDRGKVKNIVGPNLHRFRELYENILDNMQHLHWNKSIASFEQSNDHSCLYHHLSLLPKTMQLLIWEHINKDGRHRDLEESLMSVSHDYECSYIVANAITRIVQRSSLTQSVKGIFTAGMVKSMKYSGQKLKKMAKSLRS
ncbi:PREDICTED: phosphatidate cytidylyltransferase, mitochondrial-like [Priapulus caudatus]|uniref:Phosphatidate cytidylyltransferase, mitochondrial n=1 Tax=Priapulus caudatus TaxID=37621 RepID=A0ABM1E738_PRICU|nr:PREDICTED: phosphatidate cytidylyltransferase, mitochondrial-like [Priapulus caudatus]